MKRCYRCEAEKPLSEFYHMHSMKSGRVNKCKDCYRADVKANRLARIEYYRAYDRRRGNRQPPEYTREYRKRNARKWDAHVLVNNRVRDGSLSKPDACEECGSYDRLHGHHDDYAKPLDVRWLCPACHRQWHIANGEAKNAS